MNMNANRFFFIVGIGMLAVGVFAGAVMDTVYADRHEHKQEDQEAREVIEAEADQPEDRTPPDEMPMDDPCPMINEEEFRRQCAARGGEAVIDHDHRCGPTPVCRMAEDQRPAPTEDTVHSEVRPLQRPEPITAEMRQTMTEEQMRERLGAYQRAFEERQRLMREQEERRRMEMEERARLLRAQRVEEMERRREASQQQLQLIRDERQREVALQVAERVNEANERMSNGALRYVDALELVLDKIETRMNIVEDATGEELGDMRTRIAQARSILEDARNAVLVQKSKEYVVEIESEQTLGQDLRKVIEELRRDHQALRDGILRPLRLIVHDVMLSLRGAAHDAGEEAVRVLSEDFRRAQSSDEE